MGPPKTGVATFRLTRLRVVARGSQKGVQKGPLLGPPFGALARRGPHMGLPDLVWARGAQKGSKRGSKKGPQKGPLLGPLLGTPARGAQKRGL